VVATVIPKYPPRPTIIATNFQKFIQSAHNGPLNNEGKGGGVLQVETVDRLWGSFGDRGSLVRFLPPTLNNLIRLHTFARDFHSSNFLLSAAQVSNMIRLWICIGFLSCEGAQGSDAYSVTTVV
jgi:hypothetical protein